MNCKNEQYFNNQTECWISQVEFSTAVNATAINIYEVFNAGGVKKVSARAADGSWTALWETQKVERITSARIFSPPIQVSLFAHEALHSHSSTFIHIASSTSYKNL